MEKIGEFGRISAPVIPLARGGTQAIGSPQATIAWVGVFFYFGVSNSAALNLLLVQLTSMDPRETIHRVVRESQRHRARRVHDELVLESSSAPP